MNILDKIFSLDKLWLDSDTKHHGLKQHSRIYFSWKIIILIP